MSPEEVIERIKALKLQDYPYTDLRFLISCLGKLGLVTTTLHKGKKIIRGRINEGKVFENISDLSYRPQEINTKYYRASTPFRTMFYGSIVPEKRSPQEPPTGRITIAFELSEFVRNDDTKGSIVITYSAWEVLDDINLVAIVHHKDFVTSTQFASELNRSYQQFAKEYRETIGDSMMVTEYFAGQFAKTKISNDYDYCISAAFSEAMVDKGLDGVLYPSVRMGGYGFNVALSPDCVNKKLRLIGAGDCTIYKNKKEICLGNDTTAIYKEGEKLKYDEVDATLRVTKEQGFKMVGL